MTVGQIANLPTRSGTNEHNVLGRVVWRGPSQGRGWRCERSKAAGIVSREKFTPPPGSGALTKVTDHPLHSPSESLENAPPFCRFSFPAPGERKVSLRQAGHSWLYSVARKTPGEGDTCRKSPSPGCSLESKENGFCGI